jgi:hypothetical protein
METRKRKLTNWNLLVKEIYRNRNANCPHRVKLRTVLRSASQVYCKQTENSEPYKYSDSETGWLRLVKTILHNSTCRKFHKEKLVKVLLRASKTYCKVKPHNDTSKTKTRKVKKVGKSENKGILASLGL